MASEMRRLLRKFLAKFVMMAAIQEAEDPIKVDFKVKDNLHGPDKMAVGWDARAVLEDDDTTDDTKKRFFESVENFYISVVDKMIAKFPFEETILADFGFINPSDAVKSMDTAAILRLAARFRATEDMSMDRLADESNDFQLMSPAELPTFDEKTTRVDEWWQKVLSMKTVMGARRFPMLSLLMQAVLTIPNSNSESERVFSMVKKLHTSYRSQMTNETLCALLATKINTDEECYDYQPSKELLKAAKAATYEYVKEHS
jgi:hypothetical protein